MSDEQDKNGSMFPFQPPPASRAPIQAPPVGESKQKKGTSSRKQLRDAKKNRKSAISVRNLFTGLVLLIIVVCAATAVIFPGTLTKIASGDVIANTEICKVTEVNSTRFFDTSCGKFEWDKVALPGTPSTKLKVGKTYKFESVGIRIEPAQVFPYVEKVELAKTAKKGKR